MVKSYIQTLSLIHIYIPINEDTTIRAYTDTLFGLTGVNKSNSDIATYKYILVEDENQVFVTIENNFLPDGKINENYTDIDLIGSASNSESLTWEASEMCIRDRT